MYTDIDSLCHRDSPRQKSVLNRFIRELFSFILHFISIIHLVELQT